MLPTPSGTLSPPPPVSAPPPPRRPSSPRRFFARLYGPATPAPTHDATADAGATSAPDAAPARVTSALSLSLPQQFSRPPPPPGAFLALPPPHAASVHGVPPPLPPLDAAHFPAGFSAFLYWAENKESPQSPHHANRSKI
ncbi:leucine-rich repeat extensin-like protein 3 [Schistocerca americana]|uniref:leucine-rich repeat extensin-like protein 3 n=1 Tax=Schistocerca americana TaxID=7009 RepID=UPI001F50073B|nr:leucine-rich repeat extensin-like protein 3 [Schistocerca americana]